MSKNPIKPVEDGRIHIRVSADLKQRFKSVCDTEGLQMTEVLVDYIHVYLRKKGSLFVGTNLPENVLDLNPGKSGE